MLIGLTKIKRLLPLTNNRLISNWFNSVWSTSTSTKNDLILSTTIKTFNLPGNKLIESNSKRLFKVPKPLPKLTFKPFIFRRKLLLNQQEQEPTEKEFLKLIKLNLNKRKSKKSKFLIKKLIKSKGVNNYKKSRLINESINHLFSHNLNLEAIELLNLNQKNKIKIKNKFNLKLLKISINSNSNTPNDLKFKFNLLLNWLNSNKLLNGEEVNDNNNHLDPKIILNLFQILLLSKNLNLLLEIFEFYLKNLPKDHNLLSEDNIKIWSKVITSTSLLTNNFKLSEIYFNRWRNLYFTTTTTASNSTSSNTTTTTPPVSSYLAMLYAYSNSKRTRGSNDPANKFLPLLSQDNLPLSTNLFNALLRLELSRRSYASVWGLWNKMKQGNWERNAMSWKLILKAKLWQIGLVGRRLNKLQLLQNQEEEERSSNGAYSTELQSLAGYESSFGPTPTELLKEFLVSHQLKTHSRPSLNLPSYKSPLLSSTLTHSPLLLNSFLKLFISVGEWQLAFIILESFSIFKLEPNEKTHGIIVVGIVTAWEKGLLDDNFGGINNFGEEITMRIPGHNYTTSGGGGGGTGGERRMEDGLIMIENILKERKMRINLWTGKEGNDTTTTSTVARELLPSTSTTSPSTSSPESSSSSSSTSESESTPLTTINSFKEFNPPPIPEWMIKREKRDLNYLKVLLKRSSGLSTFEWEESLILFRKEVLPDRMNRKKVFMKNLSSSIVDKKKNEKRKGKKKEKK